MKSLFLASLICLSMLPAANALAPNDAIKNPMQQLGLLFKQIGKTMSDPSQNATNASSAGQIASLFGSVVGETPDAIGDLPSDQQTAAEADYQKMIGREISLANQMQSAFTGGDNAGAANLYQQMNALKLDGHSKYNP